MPQYIAPNLGFDLRIEFSNKFSVIRDSLTRVSITMQLYEHLNLI